MREKDIEQYFTKKIKRMGGKAYKWVSPGNAGVPDRIVCFSGGHIAFVELKAPGKKPTALQSARHRELEQLGHKVVVIDSIEGVNAFLQEAVNSEVHTA